MIIGQITCTYEKSLNQINQDRWLCSMDMFFHHLKISFPKCTRISEISVHIQFHQANQTDAKHAIKVLQTQMWPLPSNLQSLEMRRCICTLITFNYLNHTQFFFLHLKTVLRGEVDRFVMGVSETQCLCCDGRKLCIFFLQTVKNYSEEKLNFPKTFLLL